MPNLITWTFGLAAEDPREYRRLRRIRERVYSRVTELSAEVIRSSEPIAFADLDRSAFTPLRPGATFGRTLDCAWLRITGEIPADSEGNVVMLGIRGEGLIYLPDGTVVDAISRVFQQGDLPHSGGRFRPLHQVRVAPGPIEIYADVAYNGWLLYELGRGTYHGAFLGRRDDETYSLYYDYLTLLVLARSTTDAPLTANLRLALKTAWSRFTAHDIPAARAALAPHLAATSESDFVYSAVGHGHLDMAWLWPLRETRRKAARTYTRALNTIDATPDYLYGTSQPQQLEWMRQQHPAIFERVKKAVAAGRLELQGSFWVETDTNLPGGESLVRQSLVGRRFLADEFGLQPEDMRLCWLPDTFGYSGNLPQILTKSGMDWFQTIKLAWNKVTVFPHRTFRWEGIDGSSVLVHMPPEGDYNSRGAADGLLRGLAQYPEKALNTALLVYGSGDGGGGPGEIHLEVTGREHDLRGLPKVVYSTASAFFRRLETMHVAHTHRGELYLETHQGTYTTQAQIKRRNRIVERKLHEAEALAVMVGTDSGAELRQHWRDVLLGHFHDILPGSSIARVNREAIETLTRIEGELDDYAAELIDRIPRPQGDLAALNLTSIPRREHVQVDGDWQVATVNPYASALLEPGGEVEGLTFTADTISNGELTLRFVASGEITSCVDASGAQHAANGMNRLVLHRDPYQFPFDAWDIGQKYLRRTPRTLRPSEVETYIDGPRVVRRQVYRWGRGSITQLVVLEAGSQLVRFETTINWRERHHMLRTEFRPVHYGDTAKCEIQFGHIERTTLERDDVERAQFEVVAHRWIATEDSGGGFALLNDGKYGHRAKSGLISLNLLRSPTFPDKTADRGIHRLTYAFRPFTDLADVISDGYRLNNPLLLAQGIEQHSLAAVDQRGVIVETIKRAETGGGVILRLYESLGAPTTTSLQTTIPHATATETDLMEQPIGAIDLERLEFTPFEIKTILLEG
ncbi:alpha-mannosidase [Lacisediminihabitans changchengi]|uniref:Alpha-mannosidase n=1 Tax=Lacisediminihabitans changchengi TaxID=2787634 RepID=A0A934W4K6_9MICO|nr:glycoside hydrolase family 38 C-terminal domain-containing protein [Lacisediminihabitans changchengi]MBK4349066.1 alpha-mannosidase [Lacisediminihabitans changchengi]